MFSTRTSMSIAIVAICSAATLFAAGCSSDDSDAAPSTSSTVDTGSGKPTARSDFNDADVTFLQQMYPHHAQAVEMARLVPSRSQDEKLRALAADVEKAQAPEMEQISALLQSFGKPAPTSTGHSGHSMEMPSSTTMPMPMPGMTSTSATPATPGTATSGTTMPGMMTTDQMNALAAASGSDFDRQWMQMMIEHHNGAIAMAETELAAGGNPDAKALATSIITAQQAEIVTMNAMLGQR